MIATLKHKFAENPFFKQSLITLVLRVIGVATLFGFSVFITNYYSENIVGEYEFIRTFLLVIGSVVLLGTEQSILFYAGKYQAKQNLHGIKKIYFKMLRIVFFSSILLSFLYVILPKTFLLFFFNNDDITYSNIKSCFYILFFYVLTLLNTEVLRALNYIYISEVFRNILKYLFVFIGAFLLLFYGDPSWLVNFYLYGFIFLAIISTIFIFKSFRESNSDYNHPTTKEIFKTSYPMALSSLCFFLMISFDIFLLKKYYSNEQVAFYATAVKLLTVLSMVIVAVNVNVAPKIATLFEQKNMIELKLLLNKSKKMIFYTNLIIGIILIVFGKFILSLFGENYVAAYYPMVILVSGQIIASFFGSIAMILNMVNKQTVFQNILIIATLLNFILNLFLIPKLEMIGAAISFVIALLFWNLVTYIYCVKFVNL